MHWKKELELRKMTLLISEQIEDGFSNCPIIVGSAASKYVKIDFIYRFDTVNSEDEICENSFEILSFSIKVFEKNSSKATVVNFDEFTNVSNLIELDRLVDLLNIELKPYYEKGEASINESDIEISF
jgi:hypothetical protein